MVPLDELGMIVQHPEEAPHFLLSRGRLELPNRLNLVHARGDLAVAHSMAQELDLSLAEDTLLGLEHQSKTGQSGEDLLKVLVMLLLGLPARAQIINVAHRVREILGDLVGEPLEAARGIAEPHGHTCPAQGAPWSREGRLVPVFRP